MMTKKEESLLEVESFAVHKEIMITNKSKSKEKSRKIDKMIHCLSFEIFTIILRFFAEGDLVCKEDAKFRCFK